MEIIKRSAFLSFFVFLSFFCYVEVTNASTIEVSNNSLVEEYRSFDVTIDDSVDSCNSYFGDPDDSQYPAYWMQWALNIIKYVAIAALLVLSTVDFIKALVSNDKDALKKAGTTTAKRFIYVVILFFLPIIVDFIMRLFGAYGTCGIG